MDFFDWAYAWNFRELAQELAPDDEAKVNYEVRKSSRGFKVPEKWDLSVIRPPRSLEISSDGLEFTDAGDSRLARLEYTSGKCEPIPSVHLLFENEFTFCWMADITNNRTRGMQTNSTFHSFPTWWSPIIPFRRIQTIIMN